MDVVALAQACADIYDGSGVWYWRTEICGINVGARRLGDGQLAIAFRGSKEPEDWIDDLNWWPRKSPLVGYCHGGFLEDMDKVLGEILAGFPGRHWLGGHSLGAARALILGGMLTEKGYAPLGIATFGTPRPGFAQLSKILLGGRFPIVSFKNRNDPVTDVPYLGGLYTRPVPQTQLDVPGPLDDLTPFRDHHMPLYLVGVKQLEA